MSSIQIYVEISKDPKNGLYTWSYGKNPSIVNSANGAITLNTQGITQIAYTLLSPGYQLIYVNLDPWICATGQISNVAINPGGEFPPNSIVITDLNGTNFGATGTTPFGVRLIARATDNLGSPIVSPDPEVVNDPPGETTP